MAGSLITEGDIGGIKAKDGRQFALNRAEDRLEIGAFAASQTNIVECGEDALIPLLLAAQQIALVLKLKHCGIAPRDELRHKRFLGYRSRCSPFTP